MKTIFLHFLFLVISSTSAHATLIGDTVTIDWQYPYVGSIFRSEDVVVGDGAEISCFGHNVGICEGYSNTDTVFDIGPSNIDINFNLVITSFFQEPFNGFIFKDLDWNGNSGGIADVILTTNIVGLSMSDVDFGYNFVSVNFGTNGDLFNGAFVSFNLITNHIVPEPYSLGLLGTGFFCLFALRRKRIASRRSIIA